jgi:hypothetical protein
MCMHLGGRRVPREEPLWGIGMDIGPDLARAGVEHLLADDVVLDVEERVRLGPDEVAEELAEPLVRVLLLGAPQLRHQDVDPIRVALDTGSGPPARARLI